MKSTIHCHTPSSLQSKPGFALIATISVMVLLVMIALAMLSLSTIELRSSQNGKAMAEAQANARLALMLAIGELQKQVGPDQRISANADILSLDEAGTEIPVVNPHWTGIWDSWIAGPLPNSVNGNYPSTVSHHQTIGSQPDDSMRPKYAQKNLHFRKWLVSLLDSDIDSTDPQNTAISLTLNGDRIPNDSSTAVQLVGEGSLGASANSADYVSARLISRMDKDASKVLGRYGWWVGDESQKARIMDDSYAAETSLTDAQKIFRTQAPASTGTKTVEGLEGITDDTQLAALPSLSTLDLVDAAVGLPSKTNFHDISTNSFGVLADVRGGGLKRDLSTILERPIQRSESSDEFMLYKFGDDDEDRVPIQDLSAYYQLYDDDPNWTNGRRGGVQHNAESSRVMQVSVPDYGNASKKDKFLRQYTSLYSSPVPIKIQFVLAVGASEITDTERTLVNDAARNEASKLRATDKYKLLLGVMPVVTLWNPNNLPLVMGTDATQMMNVSFPPFVLRWLKYRADGTTFTSNYLNLNYAIGRESTGDARARSLNPYIIKLRFARNNPIVFQPGESKMFSIPVADNNLLTNNGTVLEGNANTFDPVNEWDPFGFYVASNSAPPTAPDVVKFKDPSSPWVGHRLVFGDGDKLALSALGEDVSPRSRRVSPTNEITGSGFSFWLSDADYVGGQNEHLRNYQFISRLGGSDSQNNPNIPFNKQLMLAGFAGGVEIPFDSETNATPGSDIVAATDNGELKGILMYSMMAGAEVNAANSGGAGAGRRISTRPFLHGSTLKAPQMADSSRSALYQYGWEWQVDRINDVEEAIQEDGDGRGYYGGGYTVESGVTHTVQQYLPVTPPISIASLSSTHLGGFSLASNSVVGNPDDAMNHYQFPPGGTDYKFAGAPLVGDFRQITATGQGGLAPHTQQAIGNSYAHPNIAADKAFTDYTFLLNTDISAADQRSTYVDHSYLANKALWDEFFFSSITPQSSDIPLYDSTSDKSAAEIANDFFFEDTFLPNRRLIPYTANISTSKFDELKSEYTDYSNGFADKIASHMMVSGPFNVNSTSVEAWKVFFSSLKGKPIAYLKDQASSVATAESENTPIAPGMLANGAPVTSSELSADPNVPIDQWTSSRSLTDEEIDQLAEAMVKQVKLRGPFLSLSEFVNRRLDGSNPEFSVKGALQAAIDDESVSVNAAFRNDTRLLDDETAGMSAEFPEALDGPIAYGSTPYVDQADILRGYAAQLTPRGDTFVIRTYGDSLDSKGDVAARAWCEAVIQRTPEYIDSSISTGDQPHTKQFDLQSNPNKVFGRKLKIVSFRWLNADEV